MRVFHDRRDPLKRLTLDANGNYLLPDIVIDPAIADRAVRVFMLGEAFDWSFPPDVVERQDEQLMTALAEVGAASALVKKLIEKDREPARKKNHGR